VLPDDAAEDVVRLALREARLQGALVFWRGFDDSLRREGRPRRPALLTALEDHRGLVLLAISLHGRTDPPRRLGGPPDRPIARSGTPAERQLDLPSNDNYIAPSVRYEVWRRPMT
jgi:hypothetical protein